MRITLAKTRLSDLLIFLLIFLCLSSCRKSKNLYFVPVGNAPTSEIEALVNHYREKFGLEIRVLPQIAPSPSDLDPKRQQLVAKNVIETMLRAYPNYAHDGSSVLIGITGQDIYPLGANWRFCFGWRIPESRSAIVSSARMNLEYAGEPLGEATLEKRLRKTVTKDIGVLYYGMSPNNNPQSVLYSGILGIQELDRATEEFASNSQTTPNIPLFAVAGILAAIICVAAIRLTQNEQDSVIAVQPELTSGENVVWAGQPSPTVIFHKEDAFLIPFSLLWGGFAIFWEAGVSGFWGGQPNGRWSFGILWGIPFVLIGQYLIWGRFFYTAWLKRRTNYAVTNRRIIVVQRGWKRQMASAYIDSLPTLLKESGSGGMGTIRFAQPQPMWSNARGFGAWNAMNISGVPTFVDIQDVESVYRLVSDLREKARTTKPSI